MTGEGTSVLIVGAGPTGLVMAIMLRQQGISCRVIDRAGQRPLTSRALAIHARTLELFNDIGILQPFLDAGHKVQHINGYTGSKQTMRVCLENLDTPYPFVLVVPQNASEDILQQYLTKAGIGIERDLELVDIHDRGKTVEVRINNEKGEEQYQEFDWVIGCDGGHSTVREIMGISFDGTDDPEKFVMGDVRLNTELDLGELHAFIGPEGVSLVIPQSRQLCRLIFHMPHVDPGHEHDTPTLQQIQDLVRERIPISMACNELVWSSHFYTHHRMAGTFRKNRVILAGDAAHVHSPAGGQGMNTGLQDAYNLAWKLGLVIHGRADPVLLNTYDAERGAVAASLLQFTDKLTRMMTTKNPILRFLRTFGLPLLSSLPFARDAMANRLSQLSVNHRKASLTWERAFPAWQSWLNGEARAFARGPHAGDRVPDCSLDVAGNEKVKTLFDLIQGFKFTLLLFVGDRAEDIEAEKLLSTAQWAEETQKDILNVCLVTTARGELPENRWPATVILDNEKKLRKKFGVASSAMYLIRPDNAVALRCPCVDDEWVRHYFETLT